MLDFQALYQLLEDNQMENWAKQLPKDLDGLIANRHGDFDSWHKTYTQLPNIEPDIIDINADCLKIAQQNNPHEPINQDRLKQQLMDFSPWRKGPYELFGVHIDTEWHSDWKWQRLKKHIAPLKKRSVLDIGCGNGYHCWRMYGEGAKLVVGVDPSWLFLAQFEVIKRYVGKSSPVFLLPMGIEMLPSELNAFDTVFSMGVFYHRRSPIDHLLQLKSTLRPGGELVFETLVVDGEEGHCLVPEDRYAKMRNVWFLPSVKTLQLWLRRCGFKNIRCVDVNQTSVEEQRASEWMTNESLIDFLDDKDLNKTVEGYQAPTRAIFIANKD